jgi:hypothetical protein
MAFISNRKNAHKHLLIVQFVLTSRALQYSLDSR